MGRPLPEGHIQEGLMGPLLVMPTEGSMKESTAELDLEFETIRDHSLSWEERTPRTFGKCPTEQHGQ